MVKDLDVRERPPSSDNIDSDSLLNDVSSMVERLRNSLAQAVNSELVLLYWRIWSRIGTELPKEGRAEYVGKGGRVG